MPFDLNSAQPVINKRFELESAQPVVDPRRDTAAVQARSRAAFQASHDSPEQTRARELDAMGPVSRYFSEWSDAIKGSGRRSYTDSPAGDLAGLAEVPLSVATGVTSLVTEPVEEIFTGKDVPRGSHVYQPQSEAGAGMVDTLGALFKPASDYFSEAFPTGVARGAEALGASPETAREIGEGGSRVLEAATLASPAKAVRGAKPAAVAPGAEAVQAGRAATGKVNPTLPRGGPGPLGEARALGFKVDPALAAMQPERVGKAQTGLTRQRLAGPGLLPRFQVENQKIANMQAAREVALDGSKPLAAQIRPALDEHSAVAQQVADATPRLIPDAEFQKAASEIGARLRDNPALETVPGIEKLRERMLGIEDMTGQQALDAIREFRASSKVNLRSLDDFSKHQVARAERAAADAFESLLERSATAGGRPELVAAFRKSRVRAAKLHDLDSALIGDNVDLSVLKNIGADNLTGRFKGLARVAEEFPDLTKTQAKVKPDRGSLSMAFSPAKLTAQRGIGRKLTERLLSEDFQRQFGDVAPEVGYDMLEPIPEPPAPPAPPSVDFSGPLELASESGFFPGAEVTPEAALAKFFSGQPIERRRGLSRDLGEGERRADIVRERQAVMDRPLGSKDLGQDLADRILADPRMRAATEADTRGNRRLALARGADTSPLTVTEDLPMGQSFGSPQPPVPLTDAEVLQIQLAPADLELQAAAQPRPSNVVSIGEARGARETRQAESLGDMISPEEMFGPPTSADASIQAAIDQLSDFGFTPEQIAEIQRRGTGQAERIADDTLSNIYERVDDPQRMPQDTLTEVLASPDFDTLPAVVKQAAWDFEDALAQRGADTKRYGGRVDDSIEKGENFLRLFEDWAAGKFTPRGR